MPTPSSVRPSMEQPSEGFAVNMTLLDLPDNLLLHHILSEFAAAPQTLLHLSCTCKHAHKLANAPGLWASFCRGHVAGELSSCFADPEHWRAADHKQLWIGLLLPYGQLLGRLWHSTTSPSGMLLAVDAEAPRLVARSIYYKTLNGGPFCHDVFAVALPGPQSKAVVRCWRDLHGAEPDQGLAQLTPAAPVATASAASASSASGTAAASDGAASGGAGSCPCSSSSSTSSSSSSSSSSSVVVDPASGFELSCQGNCANLAIEMMSRRLARQRYAAVRQEHLPALMQLMQQQQQQQTSGQAGSSNVDIAAQQQLPAALAPLPEALPESHIDLFHLITVSETMREADPVFRPLSLASWLPAAGLQATAAASSSAAAAGATAGAVALAPEAAEACAGASAAALALPGYWRGTYGSHGVELVQLQLLLAPPGYSMFAAQSAAGEPAAETAVAGVAADGDSVAALAADNAAEAALGVLLAGVAGLSSVPARRAGGAAATAANAVVADEHPEQQLQQEQQQHVNATATQEQHHQQQQQRQLILVATKLTGDENVPAGAVTFALDLGSRCTAGAGSLLVLPPGTDPDVQINRAGMRHLNIKERYRGRAQIAFTNFEGPQIIAAELLLFDSPDCFGLMWKRPVDGFSLFSRASQLPGCN